MVIIQNLKQEQKHLHVIDNTTNDQENTDTFGEDTYTAAGTLETVQENIISTRNAIIQTNQLKMKDLLEH